MKRIITGVILSLVVLGVLALPNHWFSPITAFFAILTTAEWVKLCRSDRYSKFVFIIILPLVILGCLFIVQARQQIFIPVIIIVSCMWIGIAAMLVTQPIRIGNSLWGKLGPEIGSLLLFGFWLALSELHKDHFWLLLTVLASAVFFDTFSLLWGMNFGKNKLAPKLSPAKSWEGIAGGSIAALTPIIIMLLADSKGWIEAQPWYALAAIVSIVFAPFGDLFESLLKRMQGVKDSGTLLPGHGGVLDRVDSHLAAVPCCAGLALLFGW